MSMLALAVLLANPVAAEERPLQLKEVQRLGTSGARAVEPFRMGEDVYVAIPQLAEDKARLALANDYVLHTGLAHRNLLHDQGRRVLKRHPWLYLHQIEQHLGRQTLICQATDAVALSLEFNDLTLGEQRRLATLGRLEARKAIFKDVQA
jgi:hypothetical protein